jgi:hypothetical protein
MRECKRTPGSDEKRELVSFHVARLKSSVARPGHRDDDLFMQNFNAEFRGNHCEGGQRPYATRRS